MVFQYAAGTGYHITIIIIFQGMSRLGSIASLDYQASFAELSQADSVVSGYIDPHVRSLVFQASLTSQGTEL